MAILENLSGEDDKTFQTGVENLQDCSTESKYLKMPNKPNVLFFPEKPDECDTAAEVYGCNNQKNPALTSATISNVNSSSPASNDVSG